MNRYVFLGAVLIVSLAVGTYFARDTGTDAIFTPAMAESTDDAVASGDVELAPDMTMGDPNAPITFIEYASYTCPHCGDFHKNVVSRLKSDYIDSGKMHFIHREVYFDRFGLWAGMIARCGGEMRYFGLADAIYASQQDWIGSGEGAEVLDNLLKIGRTAGMNDDQMNACLQDEEMAQSMVAAYQTHAQADGINATPTMVINGEKHSNMSYDDLKTLLDGLLDG